MTDAVLIILTFLVIAIFGAVAGVTVDILYMQYGLPMLILIIGSGVYTLQTKGVAGIAEDFATSIFVGVVSSFLTLLIIEEQN